MLDLVLTAAVIAVTLACLVRLALRRGDAPHTEGSVDVAHALMGIGMVAMFLSGLVRLPAAVWAALFIANAAWMAVLALRRRPAGTYLHHVVSGLAMAYMFAAARPQEPAPRGLSLSTAHSSGHLHGAVAVVEAQPAGFAFPLVAWVLMVYCALSAGFAGTDLLRAPPTCHRPAPRLTAITELVLSLSMAYMFLTML
ncbi:DUF5134 domain-containing protein [Saccharopolyspora sp. K220]|uniref:DUF5134 domain-containing protein n=1 Tax=Saccharopolyspora soli TaxID=2926618 RepID=UPI001F5693E4|nr:DUF5134 domain-containing protein [Saccharopolyspora soli]MCI2416109.1 DUF5134 domain-containing protein [Saccharopolyspora soli]